MHHNHTEAHDIQKADLARRRSGAPQRLCSSTSTASRLQLSWARVRNAIRFVATAAPQSKTHVSRTYDKHNVFRMLAIMPTIGLIAGCATRPSPGVTHSVRTMISER